jgi:hypothetical protein
MCPLERIGNVKYLRNDEVRIDHPTIDHDAKNQARNQLNDADERRPFSTLEDRIFQPLISLAKTRNIIERFVDTTRVEIGGGWGKRGHPQRYQPDVLFNVGSYLIAYLLPLRLARSAARFTGRRTRLFDRRFFAVVEQTERFLFVVERHLLPGKDAH